MWFLILLLLGPSQPQPHAPKFLSAPHIATELEDIRLSVQITPHREIRSVIVELWQSAEADIADQDVVSADDGLTPAYTCEPQMLVTSSVKEVTDLNIDQRTFDFYWRGPFHAGSYVLITRAALGRGLTTGATKQCLVIR